MKRFPGLVCGKRGKMIEQRLKLLSRAGEERTAEAYYAKKLSRMLRFFCMGGGLLLLMGILLPGKTIWMESAVMIRPTAGELETELVAQIEGSPAVSVPILLKERSLAEEEKRALFEEVLESLEEEILGENKSLDEVRSSLNLPASFLDGKVLAEWEVDPPDYLDFTGAFIEEPPNEGAAAALRVTLKIEEEEVMQEFFVRLLPPIKTQEEKAASLLTGLVQKADKEQAFESQVILPQKTEEKAVFWGRAQKSPLPVGLLLLISGLLYFFVRDDQELEKEEKRRKRQLIMDYPVILYKMSMLLGAGMTIRGAFTKIADHYKEQDKQEIRYAYEEMLMACCEMEQGVGEGKAYENFGGKCRDLRYIKFASLLSQNLKKGSDNLAELLEEEAANGMEERKNLARKIGEEAGTKLLLPMMLMLILVMVILMAPAMITF